LELAEKAYQQAISLKPNFHQALNCLGDVYRSQGRNEKALHSYSKAIAVQPADAAAYRSMAAIRQFSRKDRYILGMKTLMGNGGLTQAERISPNFAIGKAYEDPKQFDAAFVYMPKETG
jgi:tetratricopeptide (TPR) repeat protein